MNHTVIGNSDPSGELGSRIRDPTRTDCDSCQAACMYGLQPSAILGKYT